MGWVASPNYLCAVTETIADLTLTRFLSQDFTTTPHHLDSIADTLPTHTPPAPPPPATPLPQTVLPPSVPPLPIRSRGPLQRPLTTVDVFMDDFILATQLPRTHRSAVRRTLFSSIDRVLRPLSPSDNPARKEPNSTKKLLQGDASWSTQKLILGWLIDTVARTVALPPHRVDRLHLLLQSFPCHQRRTSRRKWQCLIGERPFLPTPIRLDLCHPPVSNRPPFPFPRCAPPAFRPSVPRCRPHNPANTVGRDC